VKGILAERRFLTEPLLLREAGLVFSAGVPRRGDLRPFDSEVVDPLIIPEAGVSENLYGIVH
jgi:hypothetical protein